MIEVLRTNDAVRLSYAVALLKEAGCHPQLLDRFMSSMEGSISAIERRLLVPDEEEKRAKDVLKALDAPPPPADAGQPE
jgi:hypothetical protein